VGARAGAPAEREHLDRGGPRGGAQGGGDRRMGDVQVGERRCRRGLWPPAPPRRGRRGRSGGSAGSVRGRGGVRRRGGGGQLDAGGTRTARREPSAGGAVGVSRNRPRASSARRDGRLGKFFVRHVECKIQAKGKRRGSRRVLWNESTGDRGASARLTSGPDRGSQNSHSTTKPPQPTRVGQRTALNDDRGFSYF
jgi:hypothetical protein